MHRVDPTSLAPLALSRPLSCSDLLHVQTAASGGILPSPHTQRPPGLGPETTFPVGPLEGPGTSSGTGPWWTRGLLEIDCPDVEASFPSPMASSSMIPRDPSSLQMLLVSSQRKQSVMSCHQALLLVRGIFLTAAISKNILSQ